MQWEQILRDFGIFGGLVIFFIYTTWKKSEATERFVREQLVELVQHSNRVIIKNIEALDRVRETIGACPLRDDLRVENHDARRPDRPNQR